jgi:hypothetical protein
MPSERPEGDSGRAVRTLTRICCWLSAAFVDDGRMLSGVREIRVNRHRCGSGSGVLRQGSYTRHPLSSVV